MGTFAKISLFAMLALLVWLTCEQLVESGKIRDDLQRVCEAPQITCPTRTPVPSPTPKP